jgi:hypothetical protein
MTAFPAKFIVQLVLKAALRTSGVELSPAFPTKLSIPLILTLTSGAFHLIGFHNRSNLPACKIQKVFRPLIGNWSKSSANPIPPFNPLKWLKISTPGGRGFSPAGKKFSL